MSKAYSQKHDHKPITRKNDCLNILLILAQAKKGGVYAK